MKKKELRDTTREHLIMGTVIGVILIWTTHLNLIKNEIHINDKNDVVFEMKMSRW